MIKILIIYNHPRIASFRIKGCLLHVSYLRRLEDPINQMCECIGQSEKLFSAFADYCSEKAKVESSPTWGKILRNVLNKIQEKNDKVSECV